MNYIFPLRIHDDTMLTRSDLKAEDSTVRDFRWRHQRRLAGAWLSKKNLFQNSSVPLVRSILYFIFEFLTTCLPAQEQKFITTCENQLWVKLHTYIHTYIQRTFWYGWFLNATTNDLMESFHCFITAGIEMIRGLWALRVGSFWVPVDWFRWDRPLSNSYLRKKDRQGVQHSILAYLRVFYDLYTVIDINKGSSSFAWESISNDDYKFKGLRGSHVKHLCQYRWRPCWICSQVLCIGIQKAANGISWRGSPIWQKFPEATPGWEPWGFGSTNHESGPDNPDNHSTL